MRTIHLYVAIICSIFATNFSYAQSDVKTETIKVWGNCGMCKSTIEKAAKKAGAKSASWDADTKDLNLSYAVNKTSATKIQQAIANAGYDTRDISANDKAYDNLHGCCQYDRKAATDTDKKCCGNAKCGSAGDDCKAEGCCKDKPCCTDKTCCKS